MVANNITLEEAMNIAVPSIGRRVQIDAPYVVDRKRQATVIMINGFKRSGKDYTVDILYSILPSEKYTLAGPLKRIIADTLGVSVELIETMKNNSLEYGVELKAYPNNQPSVVIDTVTMRSILQTFGTEATKPWFGDNVWVDVFLRKNIDAKFIIITDWRFYIEYEEIVKRYAKVVTVRIHDDNIVSTDLHASETELLDGGFNYDYTIDNTEKDHSALTSSVHAMIRELL
jgi:hypothetical protein